MVRISREIPQISICRNAYCAPLKRDKSELLSIRYFKRYPSRSDELRSMNPQMRRNAISIIDIIIVYNYRTCTSRCCFISRTFRGSKSHDGVQIQLFSSECYLQMARGSENVRYILCITKNYLLHAPFFCLCSRFPRAAGPLTTRRFFRFSRARRLPPCTFLCFLLEAERTLCARVVRG